MATAKTLNLGDGTNTTVTLNNYGNVYARGGRVYSNNSDGYGSGFTTEDKSGIKMSLTKSSTSSAHGLYSYGYNTKNDNTATNSTFVSSEKWMVYRDSEGNVRLNGNATSATTATTASAANTVANKQFAGSADGTTYYMPFLVGTSEGTNRYVYAGDSTYGAPRVYLKTGTTSDKGYAQITLGNSVATGSAKNCMGRLILYSSDTSYGVIQQAAPAQAGNLTHILPGTSGTILNNTLLYYRKNDNTNAGVSPSGENWISKCTSKSSSKYTIDTANSYLCKITLYGHTWVFMNMKITQSGNNFSAKTATGLVQLPSGLYNTKCNQTVIWSGPTTEATGAAPNAYITTAGVLTIRMNGNATNCNDNYFSGFWEAY